MWFNSYFSNYNNMFMSCFNPFMNIINSIMPVNNFSGNNFFTNNIWQIPQSMPNYNNSIFQNSYQNNIFNQINSSANYQKEQVSNLEDFLTVAHSTETTATTKVKTETLKQNLIHGVNYNKEKGEKLAENVVAGLPTDRDPNNPLCARYVKQAMVKSGFGPYIDGNGEYCKYILRANDNFKEVKVKADELASLPKGSVIVYDANEICKNEKGETKHICEDGHVTVALGNGKACSDELEDEILKTDRSYVFIPV